MEAVRHYGRYVVNIVALILAVLALPEWAALVPLESIPYLVAVTAALNTLLSWLRPLTEIRP